MNIVIWTGAAWEDWTPESINNGGIAGSETAAAHMARCLVKQGHSVRVFNRCGDKSGEYDGVRYHNYTDFPSYSHNHESIDVFVSSRDKTATQFFPLLKAKLNILWSHDVHVGDDWENKLDKFDRIFCVSNWAKETFATTYPLLHPDKIEVTRNGIDTSLFRPELSMDEFILYKNSILKFHGPVFTYSSCPSRGLDKLLDYWPRVKEILPKASLNIYYGFHNLQSLAKDRRIESHRANWLHERIVEVVKNTGDVYFYGRVGQADLAQQWMQTYLWLYPTNWLETSCITAMEAQAAGAVPVCTRLAALAETVSDDTGAFVEPYNTDVDFEERFLAKVRWMKEHPMIHEVKMASGRDRTMRLCSWDSVAAQWGTRFEELIREKDRHGK